MATLFDEIVGAAELPHVYCRKIKLEEAYASSGGISDVGGNIFYAVPTLDNKNVKITLNLVIHQKVIAGALDAGNSWFYDTFNFNNSKLDLLNYLYVHVQPIRDVKFLKPKSDILVPPGYFLNGLIGTGVDLTYSNYGNIYSAQSILNYNNDDRKNTWFP